MNDKFGRWDFNYFYTCISKKPSQPKHWGSEI